jgi:hypothetical protein
VHHLPSIIADDALRIGLAEGPRIEQDKFVEAFRTNDNPIGVKSFLEQGSGTARCRVRDPTQLRWCEADSSTGWRAE